jgi:hypothetical protein
MSQKQDSWDDLLQGWNENDAEIDKQIPSKNVLMDQINKQRRDNRIEAIVSMIASITLTSYIISQMYLGLPSTFDVILYSVCLALAVSVGLFKFVSARRSIVASTVSSKKHIVVLLEQSKKNLKALLFSRIIGALVLLIALLLLGTIVYVGLNKALEFKHYLVGCIALGCCLLFAGVFIYSKKQRTLLEQEIEFLTELDNT